MKDAPTEKPVLEAAGWLAELIAAGWTRCFIADEPRLSEAVETYRELGLEVCLVPVPLEELACSECLGQAPDRFRLILTRPGASDQSR